MNIDINNIEKLDLKNYDMIINFAAESHVDNSISNPNSFSKTNVQGLVNLLNFAKQNKIEKFVHISTDEVYGSSMNKKFKEDDKFNPSSPYSASKAAAELFCNAYKNTYNQKILVVRPCNNFGFFQQPEKFIPFSILNLINGRDVEIYGNGKNIRNWLHVEDTSSALISLFEKNIYEGVFNISSDYYLDNYTLAKKIIEVGEFSKEKLTFVKDRPGHDFKYATNNSKIKEIGWKPQKSLNTSLYEIIKWYSDNKFWWKTEYTKTLKMRKNRFSIKPING